MTSEDYVCWICGHTTKELWSPDSSGGLIAVMDITSTFRLVCPTTECAEALYSTESGLKSMGEKK